MVIEKETKTNRTEAAILMRPHHRRIRELLAKLAAAIKEANRQRFSIRVNLR